MSAAEMLIERKDAIARAITNALYEERPQLLERYGDVGRKRCLEDMHYNIEHIAPAVALGQPDLFERYVIWLRDMLGARNVPADDVRRSLELTVDIVRRELAAEHADQIVDVVNAGIVALGQ